MVRLVCYKKNSLRVKMRAEKVCGFLAHKPRYWNTLLPKSLSKYHFVVLVVIDSHDIVLIQTTNFQVSSLSFLPDNLVQWPVKICWSMQISLDKKNKSEYTSCMYTVSFTPCMYKTDSFFPPRYFLNIHEENAKGPTI